MFWCVQWAEQECKSRSDKSIEQGSAHHYLSKARSMGPKRSQPQHQLKGQHRQLPFGFFSGFPLLACFMLLVGPLSTMRPCSFCLDPSSWPRLSERCPFLLFRRKVALACSVSGHAGGIGWLLSDCCSTSGFGRATVQLSCSPWAEVSH